MISKPNDWDSLESATPGESNFPKIVPGAYVCIVRNVIDHPDKEFLQIEFDVYEGDLKGTAVDRYEKWGKWPVDCTYRAYYTAKGMRFFKGLITAFEDTNRDFKFKWENPRCLENKGVGFVFGEEEYYAKDGSLKTSVKPQYGISAKRVRDGDFTIPKKKEARNKPVTVYAEPNFADDPDAELPF